MLYLYCSGRRKRDALDHAAYRKGGQALKNELLKDMDAVENVMIRTADRCDIWQDRAIYAIAKAVYDLLKLAIKKERRNE